MKRAYPFCVVLCFLLTCCQHPLNSPEKNERIVKIDLHQYMLPASDLLQGKVYCYVDSIGAYKQFEYLQETVSGSDTFFDAVEYDSSFAKNGEEKDQFTREGISTVSIQTFKDGIGTRVQIDSGLIPWIHPLQSGDTSIHASFTMEIGSGHAIANMDGGFDTVTDKSLLGSHPAQDCILENTAFHIDAGASSRAIPVTKEAYCLCKGVGEIGVIDSHGRRRWLKKIISKNAFDSLNIQR